MIEKFLRMPSRIYSDTTKSGKVTHLSNLPPLRDLPECGVLEVIGEEVVKG